MEVLAFKKLLAFFTAAALAILAAGCSSGAQKNPSARDDSLQKMLSSGRFIIGLDVEFPPMGFIDESGEIVGFDVDVAQEVCNRMGVKLVKQPIDWATKEETLNRGEIDCIWSAMSITPVRAEAMNLSEPYMQNELIFLVPTDSDARSPRDLRGKTVGLQPYTSEQDVLEAAEFYEDISVVYGNDYVELMRQMQEGKLDAVFTDSVFAYYYIYSGGDPFYVLSDSLGEDEYAIGFRKHDQALRDRVQQILNEMSTDGTLSELSKKWFGSDITLVR